MSAKPGSRALFRQFLIEVRADLVPVERRGHRRPRQRAHAVHACQQAPVAVLQVVDVDLARARSDGARDRGDLGLGLTEDARQHLAEGARLLVRALSAQRDQDVQARGAAGLDEAGQADLVAQAAGHLRAPDEGAHLGVEVGRARVEVERSYEQPLRVLRPDVEEDRGGQVRSVVAGLDRAVRGVGVAVSLQLSAFSYLADVAVLRPLVSERSVS